MSVALTPAHLRAKIEDLDKSGTRYPVIGIRLGSPWNGGDRLRVGAEELDVAECGSVLEVRERIALRRSEGPRLVVLTAIPEPELGEDVLVRFARRKLLTIDRWELVKSLFRARDLDPRLTRWEWMAEALLAGAPAAGYAPVAAGILDRDTAWGAILERDLGLGVARPDAVELLAWTLDPAVASRFALLASDRRAAIEEWLSEGAGEVGRLVMRAFEAGFGSDAVSIGLACGLVFEDDRSGDPALARAQARLERFVGGPPLAAEAARRWAAAAFDVVAERLRGLGLASVRAPLTRFDEVLREVQADEHSHRSDLSPAGLTVRLERFAQELERLIAGQTELVEALEARADEVRRHRLLGDRPGTEERVDLAVRLARWWIVEGRQTNGGRGEPAPSLPDAMRAYVTSGALVDGARAALREGDEVASLNRACASLATRAAEAREEENRRFGSLVASWLETGARHPTIVPIEDVLDVLVRPLAASRPVLVVVLDGLSWAVLYELLDDLMNRGWVPLAAEETGSSIGSNPLASRMVLAAFPTITEVCRASLLTGRLAAGDAAAEKRGFATHRGLVAASKPKFPPVLFHKADLLDAGRGGLADKVRSEIASTDRRVVGVVLNAVDDYLAKSDQLRVRWRVGVIEHLEALLGEARNAGRVVVVTSDHGHVVEAGTTLRAAETGSRWRPAENPAQADEVLLAGPRVVSAGGAIVVPWSERVRYGNKQTGYHGGVASQEAIVPFAVLASVNEVPAIEGWTETAVGYPAWWVGDEGTVAGETGAPTPGSRPKKRPRAEPQLSLGLEPALAPAVAPTPPRAEPAWLGRLMGSVVFARQREMASRTPLSDERVREFLLALERNGGRLTRLALQQRLGVPPARVGGLIATMQRILNVDAYSVLHEDLAAETVELNVPLLLAQFEIGP